MSKNKRYAFWEYDQFPFVLSGEIVGRADSDGMVKVKGYDRRFTPLHVLTGTRGKVTSESLNWLKGRYREKQDALKQDFYKRALALAPFLKSCKHLQVE